MSKSPRHHDLDALRAASMLIGIFYHAALSFASGFPWMVQDVVQAKWPFVFQAWVHGFRMQLFMLASGFFTAMLWRRKGLKALLQHRCQRILIPCLLGLITVVPAMIGAVTFASGRASASFRPPAPPAAATNLWTAIQLGEVRTVKAHLPSPESVTNLHPVFGIAPIQWAALNNQPDVVTLLIERGSPVDVRGAEGHTALHGAAFMGHDNVVRLLLERGADVNAASQKGETPLQSAGMDISAVIYISRLLSLPVDEAHWAEGRKLLRPRLVAAGARETASPPSQSTSSWKAVRDFVLNQPVFILIWFLWMLVWLLGFFTLYAVVAERRGWRLRSHGFLLSPRNIAWLVPMTMVPTAFMDFSVGIGPDTSMSIVPMPHVLLYYALFFFFGALYYDCDDRSNALGRGWRWQLPMSLFVIFPLALEFSTGTFGFRDALVPSGWHRNASVLFQAMFAWWMCFASIGLFRALVTREHRFIRYLSDSSYWLYLAHLPLCIVGQSLISRWQAPVWIKLPLFSVLLTVLLLLSYQLLVRNTWIGRLLNGPRPSPHTSNTAGGSPLASG